MSRQPISPRILSLAGLGVAMTLGAALIAPTLAKEGEDSAAPEVRREVRVFRHGGPDGGPKSDAPLPERLSALRARLTEEEQACEDRLDEAGRLLSKADEAMADGDEAVARALVNEAERMLHGGMKNFDVRMMAPMAGGQGMGMMAPMPGHGGPMAGFSGHGSNARKIEVEINGDEVHVSGETKDGEPFDVRGTKEEVQEQLEELGVDVQLGGGPGGPMVWHGQNGGPMAHEFAIELDGEAWEEHLDQWIDEGIDNAIGGMGVGPGMHGQGEALSDEERASLQSEAARGLRDAAALMEQGKHQEAMELIHEAMMDTHRLTGMGGQHPMVIRKVIRDEESAAPKADAPKTAPRAEETERLAE